MAPNWAEKQNKLALGRYYRYLILKLDQKQGRWRRR